MDLILGMELGWGHKAVHWREESRVIGFCLVSWKWRQRMRRRHVRWSAAELGVRLGDWIWENGERDEVGSYPTCLTGWSGLWVPRKCLSGMGWVKARDGTREAWRERYV